MDSVSRNALAISFVVRPPRDRSVKETWASLASEGWQQANIRAAVVGIVAHIVVIRHRLCALPHRLRLLFEEGNLVRVSALAPQLIDGSIARRGRDPCGGIVGTVTGPALQSDREGILDRFFSEVDVA